MPSHLIERPKQGFSIPIESWLKTSLKDWAEDLLEKNKLEDNIFYDHKMIRKNGRNISQGNIIGIIHYGMS